MKLEYICTAFGKRAVNHRVPYGMIQYVETLPIPSEPHGGWWVFNEQRGYVSVPSNSRALLQVLAQAEVVP